MDPLTIGARNWQDGRRITQYCIDKAYDPKDILALREMHRLHLDARIGSQQGSPMEVLEAIANADSQIRQMLRNVGSTTDLALCDALFRLADNRQYSQRILETYLRDIKPTLGL